MNPCCQLCGVDLEPNSEKQFCDRCQRLLAVEPLLPRLYALLAGCQQHFGDRHVLGRQAEELLAGLASAAPVKGDK